MSSIILFFMLCLQFWIQHQHQPQLSSHHLVSTFILLWVQSYILLHCSSDHMTIDWHHDFVSTWEPTRLVGTAWTINEPHLSETTVQGRGRRIILPFKILHKSMQKIIWCHYISWYNIFYTLVIQLQVRSKLLIHT